MQASHTADVCARVMGLAAGRQILLTRSAFDNARQYVREHPSRGLSASLSPAISEANGSDLESQATEEAASPLVWLSHGRYLLKGREEPIEVCEVGVRGFAPLAAPHDSEQARRADSLEEQQMRGWRPSLRQEIPRRAGWIIEEKLGEGGFGEVWLARHVSTRDPRVFKFCFEAQRLGSFKRELTLFRLLRQALGRHDDIAPLLDMELDEAPYFLASEYVAGKRIRGGG